jgi:hypothetical protein
LRLLDWKFVIPNNKEFQFIMIEIIITFFIQIKIQCSF